MSQELWRQIICRAVWVATGVLLSMGNLPAQDPAEPPIEQGETQVRVLDPEGFPVADALVFCTGLRTVQEPGSHWGWPTEIPLPKLRTDEQGLVSYPYPKKIGEAQDVGQITWSVVHSEFVAFRDDRSLDDTPAEIKLTRGFKIAASAVDSRDGSAIKENLHAVISGGSESWKMFENGMLVSPTLAPNTQRVRLVKIENGQAVGFSAAIDVDPADKSRVIMKDVPIRPGVKLTGRLADDVPRPVAKGRVGLVIIDADKSAGRDEWWWGDWAEITAEGTFEFPNVPPDAVVQLIPICEGWVPRQPPMGLVRSFFPEERNLVPARSYPTPFRVTQEPLEVELALDPGKTLRVQVTDSEGKPLAGVEVSVWPNQMLFNGGSQILGNFGSTAQALSQPEGYRAQRWEDHPFSQRKTDDQGWVTIAGLPPKYNHGLAVYLPGFIVEEGQSFVEQLQLSKQEVTELKVVLVRTK